MTSTPVSRVATLAPLLQGAARGFRRFPLTIAAGVIAATCAILLQEDLVGHRILERLLAASGLGLSLTIGLRLFVEGRGWRGPTRWLPDLAAVAALAWFAAAWPAWSEDVQFARLFQLAAVFHLFVAVAPFVRGSEGPEFWEYNRTLFERAILAALYSVVLFVGSAVAVLALEKLFGVGVSRNAYVRLWFLAVFVFSPWFFVSGLPEGLAELDQEEDYPRGLRAFTRFALLPIVAIYLLILLAYFVKVLVTWQWPSGWIGWLVSAVAVAGLFSLLLVHPLAKRPGDRWVGTYARAFYALLLPAIVMLWLAIWQRVAQYGVTERRYFLIVLSVWLFGVAVYQLVTRARGIRVIPATLCVGALLTFAGPWGAYAVSEHSQVGRLADILKRHDMLVDGHVASATHDVPMEDRREITAILRYLGRAHGFDAIAPWFPDSVRPRNDSLPSDAGPLIAALGIQPVEQLPSETGPFRFAVRAGDAALPIDGYASLVRVRGWTVGPPPDSGWAARGDEADATLRIYRNGIVMAEFPLRPMIEALRAAGGPARGLAPERLRMLSIDPRDGMLYLRVVGGRVEDGRAVITELTGEAALTATAEGR